MRFMIIRRADRATEAGVMPSEQMLAVMGSYMQDMANAGVLLGGEGLKPTSQGALVKFTNGKPRVIDGPFAEAKELIGGYALIQVKSREEALEWVKRWPAVDVNTNVELELRELYEADDFGKEFTPELREQEERMRSQIGTK
jgi:hypothetical protein